MRPRVVIVPFQLACSIFLQNPVHSAVGFLGTQTPPTLSHNMAHARADALLRFEQALGLEAGLLALAACKPNPDFVEPASTSSASSASSSPSSTGPPKRQLLQAGGSCEIPKYILTIRLALDPATDAEEYR